MGAAALALALSPVPAAAWGPPRTGKFGPNVLRGGGGADFIRGGEGNDRIVGRAGDDLLTGDTGPDAITGGTGKDTLIGGSGNDSLAGGDGDDLFSGGFGADKLDGGPGGDALEGNQDADVISGGPGDDVIHGGSGIDKIDGGPGADRIFADSGGDSIRGGDGDDAIVVDGAAWVKVSCGAGRDTLYLTIPPTATADYVNTDPGRYSRDCEIVELTDAVQDPNKGVTYLAPDAGGARAGTARDDVLLGGVGSDTLRGLGGNDVLWGLRTAGLTSSLPDVIEGGPGDDTVYGGPGPQRIRGGAGDDFLESGIGDGTIDGNSGDDTIRLRGAGSVRVRAGAGRDTIYARGASRGTIACGDGRDVVYVDAADRTTRDCERVVDKAGTRTTRTRRDPAGPRQAAAPTYADLVAATPGLKHWWRMRPSEEVANAPLPPFGVGGTSYSSGLIDSITKLQGSYFQPTGRGPTDDGDTAYESPPTNSQSLNTGVDDADLQGDFTFEGWWRPDDSGVAREMAGGGALKLVREADGALHATVSSYVDTLVVDLRTPPLALTGRWHHIAVTRTADRIAIFVDGVSVADGPAIVLTNSATPNYWYLAGSYEPVTHWVGGIDEVAVYDRALDAATISAHARVGEDGLPPVTGTNPAFGPLQSPNPTARFVTAKGGSTFRCGLDGAALAACPAVYAMTNLAAGSHELRVQATDRFGLTEQTPALLAFTVDTTLPNTFALVRLESDGARRAIVAMASDKPGSTYRCAIGDLGNFFGGTGGNSSFNDFFFQPCNSGYQAPRGQLLQIQARDPAGNFDPSPLRIFVPPRGQGFAGSESGLPTFAGARAEVGIQGTPPFAGLAPYECRIDGANWAACSFTFRLPILHAGRHTLQARQRLASSGVVMTTPPIVTHVAASRNETTIAGLQTTLVIERPSLARRPPIVRLALDRPAALHVEIVRGRKALVQVDAKGTTGANLVTIPAARLRRLPTGRYSLVVSARGSSGRTAVQRLPLALVRGLG